MSKHSFDAHIVIEWAGTKEYAAEKILEHCMDADIACSLHEEGTLNVQQLRAEVTELKKALEGLHYHHKKFEPLCQLCIDQMMIVDPEYDEVSGSQK